MKRTQLAFPFKTEERYVFIENKIWYIPEHCFEGTDFYFPGWSSPSFFGNDQPICLEYCSGNGAWITAKAKENPHLNWVAVELKFSRAKKIWSAMQRLCLENLLVVCGEGLQLTRQFLAASSIQEVYVNFPDPWPKRKHAVHRIIQSPFIKEMGRILKNEGKMTLVTDDLTYSSQMIEVVRSHPIFQSLVGESYYTTDYPDYGASYFADLWKSKGKNIYYHRFVKKGEEL